MGQNQVIKRYVVNSTWTAPAGVNNARVTVQKKLNYGIGNNSYSQGAYTGFIDQSKNMWTYGIATNGVLGDGTIVQKSSPVLVVGGLRFQKAVLCPGASMFALDDQGSIWGWGSNAVGQLGDGTVTPRSSPVAVIGGYKFVDLISSQESSGNAYSLAVTEKGNIYGWGFNTDGICGDGTSGNTRSSPVLVVGGLKFKSVMATGYTAFAQTQSGQLYAWGYNAAGSMGNGAATGAANASPVLVLGGLTFVKINVFQDTVRGLTTAGDLYGWGSNASGQLGDGTQLARSSPTLVVGGLKWKDFTSDVSNTWGITIAGDLYAWGSNTFGQLGDGTIAAKSSPVLVVGALKWASIVTQLSQSIGGITTAGDAYFWGNNSNGQMGDGTIASKSSPTLVVGGLKWTQLVTGGNVTSTGIATDGNIYRWGTNANGQVGDGTVTAKSSPVANVGVANIGISPQSSVKTISVVPGTTYQINLLQMNVMFGSEFIAAGSYDELVLEYST